MATELMTHLELIKSGNGKISPGEEYRISTAADVGDGVWQGDLAVCIIDEVPDDYTMANPSNDAHLQLVPGNTQGSRHCLENHATANVYHPPGWSHDASYEGFDGPVLECLDETRIIHPTHGPVVIPAGFTVSCYYQRNLDVERQRERRALD